MGNRLYGRRIWGGPERYRLGECGATWPTAAAGIVLSPECVESLLCSGETSYAAELPGVREESAWGQDGLDLKDHLSGIEEMIIRKALGEANGAVAGAARLLGMRRTTLVEKLRRYRLTG